MRTGQFVTAAAEWLLDNFHLVDVGDPRHPPAICPRTYYRELPTLASREHAGHTRIYAMAVELMRHSDSRSIASSSRGSSTATSASRR